MDEEQEATYHRYLHENRQFPDKEQEALFEPLQKCLDRCKALKRAVREGKDVHPNELKKALNDYRKEQRNLHERMGNVLTSAAHDDRESLYAGTEAIAESKLDDPEVEHSNTKELAARLDATQTLIDDYKAQQFLPDPRILTHAKGSQKSAFEELEEGFTGFFGFGPTDAEKNQAENELLLGDIDAHIESHEAFMDHTKKMSEIGAKSHKMMEGFGEGFTIASEDQDFTRMRLNVISDELAAERGIKYDRSKALTSQADLEGLAQMHAMLHEAQETVTNLSERLDGMDAQLAELSDIVNEFDEHAEGRAIPKSRALCSGDTFSDDIYNVRVSLEEVQATIDRVAELSPAERVEFLHSDAYREMAATIKTLTSEASYDAQDNLHHVTKELATQVDLIDQIVTAEAFPEKSEQVAALQVEKATLEEERDKVEASLQTKKVEFQERKREMVAQKDEFVERHKELSRSIAEKEGELKILKENQLEAIDEIEGELMFLDSDIQDAADKILEAEASITETYQKKIDQEKARLKEWEGTPPEGKLDSGILKAKLDEKVNHIISSQKTHQFSASLRIELQEEAKKNTPQGDIHELSPANRANDYIKQNAADLARYFTYEHKNEIISLEQSELQRLQKATFERMTKVIHEHFEKGGTNPDTLTTMDVFEKMKTQENRPTFKLFGKIFNVPKFLQGKVRSQAKTMGEERNWTIEGILEGKKNKYKDKSDNKNPTLKALADETRTEGQQVQRVVENKVQSLEKERDEALNSGELKDARDTKKDAEEKTQELSAKKDDIEYGTGAAERKELEDHIKDLRSQHSALREQSQVFREAAEKENAAQKEEWEALKRQQETLTQQIETVDASLSSSNEGLKPKLLRLRNQMKVVGAAVEGLEYTQEMPDQVEPAISAAQKTVQQQKQRRDDALATVDQHDKDAQLCDVGKAGQKARRAGVEPASAASKGQSFRGNPRATRVSGRGQ